MKYIYILIFYTYRHIHTHIYIHFSFLQKELGKAVKYHPTATEELVELFKAQQLADDSRTDDSTATQDIKQIQKV